MGAKVFRFAMKYRCSALCNIPRMIMTFILPDVKYQVCGDCHCSSAESEDFYSLSNTKERIGRVPVRALLENEMLDLPVLGFSTRYPVVVDIVRAGKGCYIGASVMFAWQFAKAHYPASLHGWMCVMAMQNHCNLLYQEDE